MVRYARFGGLFNEVWKMSFQGKKIQILVFYPPLPEYTDPTVYFHLHQSFEQTKKMTFFSPQL